MSDKKFLKMVLSTKYMACLILRKAHTQAAATGNYYKVLGISPSASQAQIKAAYFELSKKHHPDRNRGSEKSAEIFREIKAAYEVLGNEKTRYEYDKERIFYNVRRPDYNYQAAKHPDYRDDAERMHYQSRTRPPFRKYSHTMGKTTFYDFDAWYEGHYGRENTEVYGHRGPRRFTYYASPMNKTQSVRQTPTEAVSLRIKSALLLLFYVAILAYGIRPTNVNKKW